MRRFLPGRLLFAVSLVTALVFVLSVASDGPQPLTPKRPVDFVLRLDSIFGDAGRCSPGCPMRLEAWQREILPWFVEEGIVDYTKPPKPRWSFHEDIKANHVLGQSDCDEGLWMNARYIDPASPWYREVHFLSTFVHELVHSQQGVACLVRDRVGVETAAVVVSLEVMAAMANNGNRLMAYALVDELQVIVLGELRYRALRDTAARAQLEELLQTIDKTAWDRAGRAQRQRYWAQRPGDYAFVLEAYAHKPYALLVKALERGELAGLALAPTSQGVDPPQYLEKHGVPTVRFDDLAYFVEHVEEMFQDN